MKKSIVAFLLAFTVSIIGYSQVTFTGQVVDENNMPLPGASVVVKGASIGAATDFDGNFEIELPQGGETLIISYIGYIPQELETVGQTSATVILQPDSQQLDEVVVTALGIEREKKSLGYASQELNNDDVVEAREPNLLNSMSGKVAGLQITNSPSGLGGSARVTIRGDASLNINGNSPLFVVDGTPISNEIVGSSGSGTQSVDYGNGAAEINPQDIESMNVLKGPAAAALYGARAANGAIIITTKKEGHKEAD